MYNGCNRSANTGFRSCRCLCWVISVLTGLLLATVGIIIGAALSATILANLAAVIVLAVALLVMLIVTLIYKCCACRRYRDDD